MVQNNKYYLSYKFSAAGQRFLGYFKQFPTRFWRIARHIYRGFTFQMSRKEYWKDEAAKYSSFSVVLLWIAELLILLLEILGLAELYETLTDFMKPKTRPLQVWEIQMAQTIFGNTINYNVVRIDEAAWAGPKQYYFCYVSFNLINSWGRMANHILIHELVHVWQYQKFGAIYMLRALIAQHTEMGYNYGGIAFIKNKLDQGEQLMDFNFEQQADIVADCFLLQQGYTPQWGIAQTEDLHYYQKIVATTVSEEQRYIA